MLELSSKEYYNRVFGSWLARRITVIGEKVIKEKAQNIVRITN
ncbi:MAG: hypothetical protein Lokiarch_21510 [Candidatus Lokiarchaeum sp. GC14_75]|nr:MAG: hypothetical protein Lokiarch_21510 [Candidatus Lokiarchaeum sp. GC14_75]